MKDTSPLMALRFHQLIMTKSPEERLLMSFSIFDAAKKIINNSILNQRLKLSPEQLKIELFLRFYGIDFDEAEKKKIMEALGNIHSA